MGIDIWVICKRCEFTCHFIEYNPSHTLIYRRHQTSYFCDHFDYNPISHVLRQVFCDPVIRNSCRSPGNHLIVLFY
jgi:hypothetical protein